MNNFEVIIGIEVHLCLNTKYKMFSKTLNSHKSIPNTNVSLTDLAFPGTLPILNKEAIKKAVWLSKELNMNLNYKNISFDRKNYYYFDLPKGFQITQQYNPIATNGYIEILDENNNLKKVEIERFHLEEDTIKQFSENNNYYLDYNRAGCPLIEIVTKPCLHSSIEATNYLKALRQIALFTDISDAKLEDGSLRADINISLRPFGSKEFNSKVEIKNINSISNVAKAIEFEIKRQTELLLLNKPIEQETRRFDDKINETVFMREKNDSVNYRYIYEPNIKTGCLKESTLNEFLDSKPKSIKEIKKELFNNDFNEKDVEILTNNYNLYKLFNKIILQIKDYKLVYKYLNTELSGLLNKDQKDFNDINEFQIKELINLFQLLINQEVNGKQSKIIIEEIYKNNKTTIEIIKEYKMEQIKDKQVLLGLITKNIQNNLELVKTYNERPERVEKTIIGLVMKDTNAQANPNITTEIFKQEITKYLK